MAKVTFVQPDGTQTVVEVEAGVNLMRAAVANSVAGIIGECGGSAMCATCHVYIAPDAASEVGDREPDEDDMLDFAAAERRPNSRLGCQVVVTEALDGLVVEVPEAQA